jgi:hypothetical protein
MPSTYVDRIQGLTTSVAVKAPVRTVATTPVTLSGLQTIDGVTLVLGDRVLVTAQANSAANGIYVASSGDWARAADFDGSLDIVRGTLVVSTNTPGSLYYRVTSADPITIGTDAITFEQVSGSLTQATVGGALWPRTAAEIAAGVVPTAYQYEPGDVRRYGTNTTPGTTNMTTAIQAALDSNPVVWFQSETYLTGLLTIPSNIEINMPPGCILQDTGILGASDRLINIAGANVVINGYGAKVAMDRADYATGEQRHGVYLYGCADVAIYGLESSDTGGDGFYLGGGVGDPATRVTLVDVKADNNRRQGISIVNAKDFILRNPTCTNTTGTAPQAGIDLEPNLATDYLSGQVVGGLMDGNAGVSLGFLLDNLDATSEPVAVRIDGVKTVGGRNGFYFRNRNASPCTGSIIVNDCQFFDSERNAIEALDWSQGVEISILNPHIENPNTDNGATLGTYGGISLYASSLATSPCGGVKIVNPVIKGDALALNATVAPIYIGSGGTQPWNDVEITNPSIAGNVAAFSWRIDAYSYGVRLNVERKNFRKAFTTSDSLVDGRNFGHVITNEGAVGAIALTLPAATANNVGWRYTFEVVAAQQLRIDPNGTDLIYGGTTGQYTVSSTKGDSITLEVAAAGEWRIADRFGAWTYV